MAKGKTGALTKLYIEAFSNAEFEDKTGKKFTAVFNPNKYNLRYEIVYGKRQATGTAANAPTFGHLKPQELALEFILDGTGVATGEKVDVQKKVDEFLKVAYKYEGKIHRNNYLRISWSTLIFDCTFVSADISYTLFDSTGYPLRATINAKFLGTVNEKLRKAIQGDTSPDLTHVRTVKGKNRIDTMTVKIYKTPDYYIDVARTNGLVNFRKLRPGNQLIFPPVTKDEQLPKEESDA